MHTLLQEIVDPDHVQDLRMFLYDLWHGDNKYLLGNDLLLGFEAFCKKHKKTDLLDSDSSIHQLLQKTQELIFTESQAVLLYRFQMSRYRVFKISISSDHVEEVPVKELLDIRDHHVNPESGKYEEKLHIDFLPFYDYSPKIRNVKSIGKGIDFLNKHMSSSLFQDPERWNARLYDFLKIHSLGEQQLLVNSETDRNYHKFVEQLEKVSGMLDKQDPKAPYADVAAMLRRHGLEPGWGDTVASIQKTMGLLIDLFQAPDRENLEAFVDRIPMISKIAIVSPHGWFGQENVLGRPDTGGQVVYILDQVRALEHTLAEKLKSYGLETMPKIIVVTRLIPNNEGTTSNQRIEKIHQTENAYILRVPFHDRNGNRVPHWISRFEIWPYLERFALEAKRELLSELNGKPDLVIGNYSDGNMVATLLSQHLGVAQCNIAHALEKNKYLFSDLYWPNFENEYHFSLQFITDLIAMNQADFIITSTFQEIAGSPYSIGQYESYQFFTMPGMMQVENGINLFHPKFNVIPPGVDTEVYFPYTEDSRRLENQREFLEKRLFEEEHESIFGNLKKPKKMPIFTMARLDFIKNITGLVESFAKSPQLKKKCNLVVIAGKIRSEDATDLEERKEIQRMYELIHQYQLEGSIRWLGMTLSKEDAGEIYRIIADRRGVFVQPGRFEGFGLTVLEAMASGLPTFATQFGGPSEIIVDKKNGFLINPTLPELISDPLLEFFARVEKEPDYWQTISEAAIQRVNEQFTWKLYSENLLKLTKLYGFWRYSVSEVGERELDRYCHLLFQLFFKPRATALLAN